MIGKIISKIGRSIKDFDIFYKDNERVKRSKNKFMRNQKKLFKINDEY